MFIESHFRRDGGPSRAQQSVVCAGDTIWLWPGIALTQTRGSRIVPLGPDILSSLLTRFHGPGPIQSGPLPAIYAAARRLSEGDSIGADRLITRAALPLSPDGALLMRSVAAAMGVPALNIPTREAPRLWSAANIAVFAPVHADAAIADLMAYSRKRDRLAKAGYRPDEARDRNGRWTDSGVGPVSRPLQQLRPRPRYGDPRRQGYRNPLLHWTAAEPSEDEPESGLVDEFFDPIAGVRWALYGSLRHQLEEIDPANDALDMVTPPDYVPRQADLDALADALQQAKLRAGRSPASFWTYGWGERGRQAELARYPEGRLHPNFPVIDRFCDGVAVSVKSIDLNAPYYRTPGNLTDRINRYVNDLAHFEGGKLADDLVHQRDIKSRVLDLVIPLDSGNASQMEEIRVSRFRAESRNVTIIYHYY